MIRVLTLGSLLLLPTAVVCEAPDYLKQANRIAKSQQRFRAAHNKWVDFTKNLSPSSPDYLDQVRKKWRKLEVGEKFARFELELMGYNTACESSLDP